MSVKYRSSDDDRLVFGPRKRSRRDSALSRSKPSLIRVASPGSTGRMLTPIRRTAAMTPKRKRWPWDAGRVARACLPRRNASACACIVLRRSAASCSGIVAEYMSASVREWVRGDVLVEPEQVGRVVAPLDVDEPGERRRRVRRADLLGAGLAGEVHVRRVGAVSADRGTGCPRPVGVHREVR